MPIWEIDLTDAKKKRLKKELSNLEEEKLDTFIEQLEGQATIQAAADAIGDADLKQIAKGQWQVRLGGYMRLSFIQTGSVLSDFQVGHT